MAKSKIQKKKPLTIKTKPLVEKEDEENTIIQPYSNSTDSLMPELEELVKKNPNRLIGCGG